MYWYSIYAYNGLANYCARLNCQHRSGGGVKVEVAARFLRVAVIINKKSIAADVTLNVSLSVHYTLKYIA